MGKLIINYKFREKRCAFLHGSVVERLFINQPKFISNVGNIYMGTVTKVVPGMNAAFVEIGEGKGGYLHRDKLASFVQDKKEKEIKEKNSISSYVHQGERLIVQVEKDATGTKGPRLTGIIEITGNNLVYMPLGRYVAVSKKIETPTARNHLRQLGFSMKHEEEGIIFRTSSENVSDVEIQEELESLRKVYSALYEKGMATKGPFPLLEKDIFLEEIEQAINKLSIDEVIVDDQDFYKTITQRNGNIPIKFYTGKVNIFSAYRVEHEIEKSLKKIVWLENGSYLIFDEAEALTVIDVNTGKYEGKHNLRQTVIRTNELAAIEVARQIRLRDIAGMILIDFIDMKEDKDRELIVKRVEDELRKDERRTKILGFTPLGILQLTRKKTKVSISETLTSRCSTCDGTGRVLSPETVAFRLERELWEHRNGDYEGVLISISNDVKKVFCDEQNIHKIRLEKTLGLKIIFSVIDYPKPFYELRQFGDVIELEKKLLP